METPKPKKTTKKKAIKSPIQPQYLIDEKQVDYHTRTVLLLDARNDLVPAFFSGMKQTAAVFKSKAINPFTDFQYTVCKAFVTTIGQYSMDIAKNRTPWGIGDILKNIKGDMRFIINVHVDKKTGDVLLMHIDPNNAKAPTQQCKVETMKSWVEKR